MLHRSLNPDTCLYRPSFGNTTQICRSKLDSKCLEEFCNNLSILHSYESNEIHIQYVSNYKIYITFLSKLEKTWVSTYYFLKLTTAPKFKVLFASKHLEPGLNNRNNQLMNLSKIRVKLWIFLLVHSIFSGQYNFLISL